MRVKELPEGAVLLGATAGVREAVQDRASHANEIHYVNILGLAAKRHGMAPPPETEALNLGSWGAGVTVVGSR